jgi:hypothetical protein
MSGDDHSLAGASLAVAVIGIIISAIVAITQPEIRCAVHLQDCPAPTGTADATQPAKVQAQQPAAPVRPIQIMDPPKETPPHGEPNVISVSGSGDIPSGRHLWAFVYGSVVNRYYPQAEVGPQNKNSWTIPGVNIGVSTENSGKYTVYVLLTDDPTNTQISAFAGVHPDGYSDQEWQTSFKALVVDQVQVQRT